MQLHLQGLTVLVTGGTKGIGKSIVDAFLREGANVAYCARSIPDPNQFAQAEAAGSSRSKATALDVSDKQAIVQWVDATLNEFGRIDIVVPNVSALNIHDFEQTFRVDLMSTVNLIQASLPHLARAGGLGSVVVIGSVSGHDLDFSAPGPYGSFKAALTHYVQGQARANAAPEKGPVRFNTVSPGNVYFDPGFWAQTERDNPAFFKQCLEANPMKRMATPEEVANAVLFLASKVSAFTSGTNLIVDGANHHGVAV